MTGRRRFASLPMTAHVMGAHCVEIGVIQEEFAGFGVSSKERGARTDQSLDSIRRVAVACGAAPGGPLRRWLHRPGAGRDLIISKPILRSRMNRNAILPDAANAWPEFGMKNRRGASVNETSSLAHIASGYQPIGQCQRNRRPRARLARIRRL